MSEKSNQPQIENRKARHDYFLSDKLEAGIVLTGFEVKSIREGKVNLKDSFVRIVGNQAFLFNCHITPYSRIQGHLEVDPVKSRKLLLHRAEIDKLMGYASQKGYAIVPTKMYFKKNRVKVEIQLGKGKQAFDKRQEIKKRIHAREADQAVKRHQHRQR